MDLVLPGAAAARASSPTAPGTGDGNAEHARAGSPVPGGRGTGAAWRRQLREVAASIFWFALAWGLLLGAWEAATHVGWLNAHILPPPSETLPYVLAGEVRIGFGQQRMGLSEAVLVTLSRVGAGMALGLAAAMLVAVAVTEIRFLRRLVLPIVQSVAPIAPVAWIPFTIVVVGIGGQAAVFIVFMAVFGTLALSLVAAIEHVAPEYLAIARNLRTSPWRLWWNVRLPAILPGALTALRMAFFGAWMAALAGEMAGINSGLGYMIVMAQQMYNMKVVMIGILVIGLIGFTVDRLLLVLNRSVVGALHGTSGDARRAS
jgi:ABC-type nitrate/sulfonate/bicarbonate transport system permease component